MPLKRRVSYPLSREELALKEKTLQKLGFTKIEPHSKPEDGQYYVHVNEVVMNGIFCKQYVVTMFSEDESPQHSGKKSQHHS